MLSSDLPDAPITDLNQRLTIRRVSDLHAVHDVNMLSWKKSRTPSFLSFHGHSFAGRTLMKCPECGKDMENGVVSSVRGGMIWSERPIWSQFSGEQIPTIWQLLRLQHLNGHRCTSCGLLITRYSKEERPQGFPPGLTGSDDYL
jgi:hypothetical protein